MKVKSFNYESYILSIVVYIKLFSKHFKIDAKYDGEKWIEMLGLDGKVNQYTPINILKSFGSNYIKPKIEMYDNHVLNKGRLTRYLNRYYDMINVKDFDNQRLTWPSYTH